MGSGVITIGRHQYAVGLYWENSPTGRVAQTAREAARQPGQQADFYAVRPGNKTGRIPQFGLGQAGAGHKSGMPTFAACISAQQPGSWAGAFRLPEGIAIVIVRDDLIVPDGDQLFANETEARDRILQEIGFGGLQRIYAPEAWSIPGADTMPVSLLLDDQKDIRLQAVQLPKKLILIIAACVAVLVIGGGIAWYIQVQEAEEAQRQEAQRLALERIRNAANNLVPPALQAPQKPNYPPPDRKWEKAPPLADVVEACRSGLSKVPSALAGWKLSHLSCSGTSISVDWTHEKGFSKPPMNSSVTPEVNSSTTTLALPPLTPRGPESLLDPADVTRRYLAQNWTATLARGADDPLPLPPPGYQGEWNPPPAPWVKRSFTISVPDLPDELTVFFGDLPGTVINSMTYAPGSGVTGGTWSIEGVIYENRI